MDRKRYLSVEFLNLLTKSSRDHFRHSRVESTVQNIDGRVQVDNERVLEPEHSLVKMKGKRKNLR